jgi:hypothetical protein
MIHSPELSSIRAIEALSQSLEAMAFVSLVPVDERPEQIDEGVLVQIKFHGDARGILEFIAPRQLGRTLVANMAPDMVDCPPAQAEDALKEFANIMCGRMLRSAGGKFDNGLPTTTPLSTDEEWKEFVAQDEVIVVDAEGTLIAVRLTLQE